MWRTETDGWTDILPQHSPHYAYTLRGKKRSRIWIRISGLIRIWIWMSARLPPKCCGFITCQCPQSFRQVRKLWPVTIWELLINVLKSLLPQWWRKWKSDPECALGIESPPNVNQFLGLLGSIITPKFQWNRLVTFAVILLTVWQNHWQTTSNKTNTCDDIT